MIVFPFPGPLADVARGDVEKRDLAEKDRLSGRPAIPLQGFVIGKPGGEFRREDRLEPLVHVAGPGHDGEMAQRRSLSQSFQVRMAWKASCPRIK